jgi:hypothetical protein
MLSDCVAYIRMPTSACHMARGQCTALLLGNVQTFQSLRILALVGSPALHLWIL